MSPMISLVWFYLKPQTPTLIDHHMLCTVEVIWENVDFLEWGFPEFGMLLDGQTNFSG